MALNPCDLADLLSTFGYFVDYDTGEVDHYLNDKQTDKSLLITLAALGQLEVQYIDGEPAFFINNLAVTDMDSYCEMYPNDPQCKFYDV